MKPTRNKERRSTKHKNTKAQKTTVPSHKINGIRTIRGLSGTYPLKNADTILQSIDSSIIFLFIYLMGRIGCCSDSTLLNAIKERSSSATVAAKSADDSDIVVRVNTKLIGAHKGIMCKVKGVRNMHISTFKLKFPNGILILSRRNI
jgi:predicted membrane channel-forming protein YqfA (hemolysin III family)